MTKTSEAQERQTGREVITDHLKVTFGELIMAAVCHGEDTSSWSLNLDWNTRRFELSCRPQWPTVVTDSPAQMYITMARRTASYQQWIEES